MSSVILHTLQLGLQALPHCNRFTLPYSTLYPMLASSDW